VLVPVECCGVTRAGWQIQEGRYTIPSFVDADIADLLRKMICVDVEQRIETSQV
jgi:hypothetical protein